MSNSLEAKICVLGAQGVGKTSLLHRYVKGTFNPPSVASTVGASFFTKRVLDVDSGTTVRLQLWDTAGQERFRAISRLYYRGASAVLLVYSIIDEQSFEEMGQWLTEMKENLGDDVILHCVGTKGDVVAQDPSLRRIPFERCIAYIAENLYPEQTTTPSITAGNASGVQSLDGNSKRSSGFWGQDIGWDCCHEVSASTGEGIEEMFRVIGRKIVEQNQKKLDQEHETATPGSHGVLGEYFDGPASDGRGSFRIKSERKERCLSVQELESSLIQGRSAIKVQYGQIEDRLRDSSADSDQVAGDALKDISTHLNADVVTNLKALLDRNITVDFFALQDVADSSHDRVVLALMQLQQRMISLGPIADVAPPTSNPSDTIAAITTSPQNASQLGEMLSKSLNFAGSDNTQEISSGLFIPPSKSLSASSVVLASSEVSPERTHGTGHKPRASTSSSIRPPSSLYAASLRPGSSLSARTSAEVASTARREANQYKPLATTTTKPGLFGIGRRTKVEPIVSPPENPLVDEYLADATERESRRLSITGSISTFATSIYQPDHPAYNAWEAYRAPSPTSSHFSHDSQKSRKESPTSSHRASPSVTSMDSMRRLPTITREILASNRSLVSIDPTDLLPSEMNNFAGFCKGAWRQQIGDRKSAMEERIRPGGMYNAAKYWQCKQCKFEGRLVPIDKKKSGYDIRVFKLVQGIQFRWEFMFKSHIKLSESANGDPTKATFACIFCCSEGVSTPHFKGITEFMQHLVVHRDPLPAGEVLYRMNCLVGRTASIDEDFDINIASREAGLM
ncbi:hypothetical protein P7C71_g341, partial [Lecanoromycetidae sp. Uapishka_2]